MVGIDVDDQEILIVARPRLRRGVLQMLGDRELVEPQVADFPNVPEPDLSWSPDGRWLVVSARESAGKPRAVFMISIETGEKRQLTFPAAGAVDNNGMLSPDCGTLAFVRGASIGR